MTAGPLAGPRTRTSAFICGRATLATLQPDASRTIVSASASPWPPRREDR